MKHNSALTVVVVVFAIGSVVAMARPGRGPPPDGQRRKPPQAAYDACAGRDVDDVCTVSHDDRTMSGTCRADHDDDSVLVCAPSGPPAGGQR